MNKPHMRLYCFTAATLLAPSCGSGSVNGLLGIPELEFLEPAADREVSRGSGFTIVLRAEDRDDAAAVTIVADADGNVGTTGDQIPLGTAVSNSNGAPIGIAVPPETLSEGSYTIVGVIQDSVNPPRQVQAAGRVKVTNVAFARRAGSSALDMASNVSVLPDCSSVVVGSFTGIATFGLGEPGQSTLQATGTDAFVARYTPTGSLVWVKASSSQQYATASQ